MEHQRLADFNELLKVELLPLEQLRPHEEFCLKNYEYWLTQVKEQQHWTNPILVDSEHNIIMDGHHRYQIALHLKLKYIPCILISYGNQFLKVSNYTDGNQMDSKQIIDTVCCGRLMSKKSTRHCLAYQLPQVKIPLEILQ